MKDRIERENSPISPKSPKKRWLAGLLAFIVPGAGHIYAGYYTRGLLLLAAVFLDISALIRFSDSTGGSRALLLVYLGLALPVLYFVSVFDALQKASAHPAELSHSESGASAKSAITFVQGAALMGAGALLLFLIRPLQPFNRGSTGSATMLPERVCLSSDC
ncbi:DUF6677 family protein [Paenibacillus beijingensis]|uniref:DUF6677 family protein n=1 Tax=Paenibacillus beijingensis TaxID=1126833 RepID=UPI0006981457|nr:DUF6677 family protein [Paenibacillus beijingensis]